MKLRAITGTPTAVPRAAQVSQRLAVRTARSHQSRQLHSSQWCVPSCQWCRVHSLSCSLCVDRSFLDRRHIASVHMISRVSTQRCVGVTECGPTGTDSACSGHPFPRCPQSQVIDELGRHEKSTTSSSEDLFVFPVGHSDHAPQAFKNDVHIVPVEHEKMVKLHMIAVQPQGTLWVFSRTLRGSSSLQQEPSIAKNCCHIEIELPTMLAHGDVDKGRAFAVWALKVQRVPGGAVSLH